MIIPRKLAKGGIKESTIVARPPSIKRGIIGTMNILERGETTGKSPEKYIRYGSIKNGKPQARIKNSRRFIFPRFGILLNFSFNIDKKVIIKKVAKKDR
mgnify:CR=1 FL=1